MQASYSHFEKEKEEKKKNTNFIRDFSNLNFFFFTSPFSEQIRSTPNSPFLSLSLSLSLIHSLFPSLLFSVSYFLDVEFRTHLVLSPWTLQFQRNSRLSSATNEAGYFVWVVWSFNQATLQLNHDNWEKYCIFLFYKNLIY